MGVRASIVGEIVDFNGIFDGDWVGIDERTGLSDANTVGLRDCTGIIVGALEYGF